MVLGLLCSISNPIFAQYNLDWDNFYGGDNFDEILSVIEVDDGLVHGGSAGSFIANMGDVPPTSGGSDYWIFKTDFSGNILWSYTYGGSSTDILQSLIATQDGGFMAVGISNSNTSAFKSEDSRGGDDVWMVKLDQDGIFEWDATFGGDVRDFPPKVIQAQDGTYFFGGWTEGDASGEVSFPNRGGLSDFWIGHVDANGGLLYDRRFGSAGDDKMFDMIQLANGDLILAGLSDSDIGGEKTENSYGGQDAWVIQMTAGGTIVWDKTYGGTFGDRAVSLAELPNGQILIGGGSSSVASGNKTSGNNGAEDYWLLTIQPNGDIVSDYTYGGAGQDELNEIKVNDKGLIYLGGKSGSDISGDKSELNRGVFDKWLIVVDGNDAVLYDKTLGGDLEDQLHDFVLLDDGGIITTGFTVSAMSGDITDVSNGAQDGLVFYLACTLDNFLDLGLDDTVCPDTEFSFDATINQPTVCSYLWEDGTTDPVRDIVITDDIDFSVTVTDNFGCPAIDTVSFTALDAPIIDLGVNEVICEGDSILLDARDLNCPTCSYLWNDMSTNPQRQVRPSFNTTYEVVATNSIGCSTTDNISVNVISNSVIRINDFTCDPQEARNDTVMLINQFGCDSITIFNIVLLPSDTVRQNEGVCDPNLVGRDTILDTNIFGCDSLVITTFFPVPSSQTNLSDETCDPLLAGIDTLILSNEFGCDSLVITETTPLSSSEETIIFESCDPSDVSRDTMIFENQFGCDSVVINVTDLLLSDTLRLNEPVCFMDEVRMDTVFLTNDQGCDSLVVTNFFFVLADTIINQQLTCNPAEVRNDTVLITNPNDCDTLIIDIVNLLPRSEDNVLLLTCDLDQAPRDTIFATNIFGCDSITYIEYQYLSNDTVEIQDYVCDGNSFSDTLYLQNIQGCDSLVITNFDTAESDELFLDGTTCDETQVGLQTFNLTNQFGCDSTVTIDFMLVEEQVTILEQNTCNPAQFIPDTFYFSTPFCDSVVIVNYNVQPESEEIVNLVSCNQADVGEFTIVLTNQQGCDSTVTQIVSFAEVDSNFVEVFECGIPDTIVEEFSFINQFGCDSIVVRTTIPGIDTTILLSNVCELDEEFRTEDIFTSVDGCDSVVVNIGLVSESFETSFEIFTCDESQVGSETLNFTSVEGCDSIVIFNTVLGEIELLVNVREIPCGETGTGQVSLSGSSGRLPYLYSFNGGPFGEQNNFTNLGVGIYEIAIQDADGCETYSEIEISEVTGVDIILPDFIQVDFGEPISLNPVVNGEYTDFFWSETGQDSLFCETCFDQNYVPLVSTALTFNVLSLDGCLEKHQVIIAVSKTYDVYIPSAFSPNGDNINDFFTVFADSDVERILSLNIYTRWGEQVFAGTDVAPSDELQGWNGQINGKLANPGVFVYSVNVLFFDGEIRHFEGDFSLIR